jgi:dTDP-4-amino-4,6-dideoxygalactose transaminase
MCLPSGHQRGVVAERLRSMGVETKPYYWPALHAGERRPAPGGLTREDLPVSSRLHRSALALPMSSEMTPADARRVVLAVDTVLAEAGVWS